MLYRRTRRELGWAGLAAVPSQTPLEYLSGCRLALEGYPRLEAALRRVTGAYVQAVYQSAPPEYREVQMSLWSWQQARWEWIRLLLRRGKIVV